MIPHNQLVDSRLSTMTSHSLSSLTLWTLAFHPLITVLFNCSDSGTSISDYSKYYPSMSDYRYAQHHENDSYFYNSDKTVSQFGKSLPLTIVTPSTQMQLSCAPTTTRTYKNKQRFTVNDDESEDHQATGLVGAVDDYIGQLDLGASMLALARSIQAEDDPERLFGERPHRRRYKTDGGLGTRLASSSRCAVTTTADRRPSAFWCAGSFLSFFMCTLVYRRFNVQARFVRFSILFFLCATNPGALFGYIFRLICICFFLFVPKLIFFESTKKSWKIFLPSFPKNFFLLIDFCKNVFFMYFYGWCAKNFFLVQKFFSLVYRKIALFFGLEKKN